MFSNALLQNDVSFQLSILIEKNANAQKFILSSETIISKMLQ